MRDKSETCFVMMPFSKELQAIYKKALVPAIESAGLKPIRGDQIFSPGSITVQIFEAIRNTKVCVADLTTRNANVMYELGLAHALGKPVVQLTQSEEDVPFDLRQYRLHIYSTGTRLWASKLQANVGSMLRAALADPSSSVVFGGETIGSAPPSTLDRIRATGVIRAGCIRQPPLLDYETDDLFGTRGVGLYARLMDQVAAERELRVQYVPLRFADMISAVQKSEVDVVLCTFPTPPRVEKVDFSAFLHRIGVAAVLRRSRTDVQTREDLLRPDIRIAVIKGEVGWEFARSGLQMANSPERFIVVEHENISAALDLVAGGEADVALADALSCLQYVSRACGSVQGMFLENPLYTYSVGVMHAKNDLEMTKWLDYNFKHARTAHEIKALETRILHEYAPVIAKVAEEAAASAR